MANLEAGTAQRIDGLDALRGMAALGIVAVHAVYMFPLGPAIPRFMGYLVLGVPLFFIISAFSMSAAYRTGLRDVAGLRCYALRRIFRIVPLFYLMLFAWLAYFDHLGSPARDPVEIFANLTFTFSIFPTLQTSIVPAGWSIGVEMLFYLFFPMILLDRRIVVACAFLMGSLLLAWQHNIPTPEVAPGYFYWTHPLTNAPYFCVGVLLWRVMAALPRQGCPILARALLVLSGLVAGCMAAFGPAITAELTYSQPVPLALIIGWGGAFAALVLSQALHPEPFLVNRTTRFLGKISYSLYLSHPLLIYASSLPLLVAGRIGVPAMTAPVVVLVVAVPAILLASVLYAVVEAPFMALGRRLTADTVAAADAETR